MIATFLALAFFLHNSRKDRDRKGSSHFDETLILIGPSSRTFGLWIPGRKKIRIYFLTMDLDCNELTEWPHTLFASLTPSRTGSAREDRRTTAPSTSLKTRSTSGPTWRDSSWLWAGSVSRKSRPEASGRCRWQVEEEGEDLQTAVHPHPFTNPHQVVLHHFKFEIRFLPILDVKERSCT